MQLLFELKASKLIETGEKKSYNEYYNLTYSIWDNIILLASPKENYKHHIK